MRLRTEDVEMEQEVQECIVGTGVLLEQLKMVMKNNSVKSLDPQVEFELPVQAQSSLADDGAGKYLPSRTI